MTGPDAAAAPNTPAHMPKAWARLTGSVMTLAMVDRALGCIMAPPAAWSIRNAIKVPRLGATEQASEPAAKTTRPAWNMRRRPIRSPVDPASSNSPAKTRV